MQNYLYEQLYFMKVLRYVQIRRLYFEVKARSNLIVSLNADHIKTQTFYVVKLKQITVKVNSVK